MRVLITGSRAPVALDLVRAFGRAGHSVYAADTIATTLGSRSRYLAGHLVLPPPRRAPHAFGQSLLEAVAHEGIDLVVPTCEEVFYVARVHKELTARARVFCEPLPNLEPWHNKYTFQQRAAALGLLTPLTVPLCSEADLWAALPQFPRYLLKPAYGRFATHIITNCGPHAGQRPLAGCRPTADQPWLLQEYINGENVCSYSMLHAGHVTAHCAYATPYTAGQGSGTAFVSLDGHATLEVARTLGQGGYTGQLSLDFLQDASGQLYLLECNPRSTSGLHLIEGRRLVAGLLDPAQPTWVEPAGRRRQLSLAVLPFAVARCLRQPLRWQPWRDLAASALASDVIISADDPLPALAQLPQVLHFMGISRRKGISLLEATTDDIEWNGNGDLHASDS